MKRICGFVISTFVLYTTIAHGSVITISGGGFGGTGINGLAEGWSQTFGAPVSISAHLVNGNFASPATGNTAYLISGSLPDLANAIATSSFDLLGFYDGMFTLFSNVNLSAGSYWLVFSSPGPPSSYANWEVEFPATITTDPGVQYLGYTMSHDNNVTFDVPVISNFAYEFTVDRVPEPGVLWLCGMGLAAVLARRYFVRSS